MGLDYGEDIVDGTRQKATWPNWWSFLIIRMSFCYHSEVIHMGYDCGEGIVDGTRHSESFSSSFHHHSEVIRLRYNFEEGIKGNQEFHIQPSDWATTYPNQHDHSWQEFLAPFQSFHNNQNSSFQCHSVVIPMSFHNTRHDKILVMERPRNEIIARSGIVLF